ncbi:MAG: DNA polymerase III subunit delta [Bdellovibrionales bacterium]|nr:DNA polymerase III subunit delta [Bdellovibrionales bacterium]
MAKKGESGITTTEFTKRVKLACDGDGPRFAALAKAKCPSPLVMLGEDPLRLRKSIEWMASTLDDGSLKVYSFNGPEITNAAKVTDVQRELGSLDMFAKSRLMVIYGADKIRAAQAKHLSESILNADQSAYVVLTGESISRNTPLLTYVKDDATVVTFKNLSPKETLRWIEREVKAAGCEAGIASDAASYLAKNFGSDLSALTNEVQKAALLAEPGEQITLKQVRDLLLKSPEFSSAELIQQIAAKNPVAVKKLAQNLLMQGMHPLQISSALTRSIRALLAAKDMPAGSRSSDDWLLRKLGTKAQNLSEAELTNAIEELCRLDESLKGSPLPDELELDCSTQRLSAP